MPTQFAFVTTNDLGKPNTADRRLIRSHCMRGKNIRDGSRRSIQQAKKAAVDSAQAQPRYLSSEVSLASVESSSTAMVMTQSAARSIAEEVTMIQERLPPPPPPDVALMRLATEIDRSSQELLFDFFLSNATQNIIFPVKLCVEYHPDGTDYFKWLFHDAAYLHAVLYAVSAMHDNRCQQALARTTYYHQRRTISLLNNRLSEKNAHLLDSTVYIVFSLALMAHACGDYAAAEKHILGLRYIVHLRGGLEVLRQDLKLHFMIDQLLLSWSLSTGDKSRFFTGAMSWDPIFQASPPSSGLISSYSLRSILNARLIAVMHDMKYLSTMIDESYSKRTLLKADIFQGSISSIQNRLLRLQGTLDTIVAQALRLAMLAFLTTMFRVPGQKGPHVRLADQLRDACQAVELSTPELYHLMMWMLIVGSISVLEPDEPWLRLQWQAVASPALTWETVRRRLQGVGWIGCIHDDSGRKAFNVLRVVPTPASNDADTLSATRV